MVSESLFYILAQNNMGILLNNQNIIRRGKNIYINNLGMRSTNLSNNEKDKFRILFYGDSVTYGGSIVNNEDLFSEKVCNNLTKMVLCLNVAIMNKWV